jgi:hypothetical protein
VLGSNWHQGLTVDAGEELIGSDYGEGIGGFMQELNELNMLRIHVTRNSDWSWAIVARQMGVPKVKVLALTEPAKERLVVIQEKINGLETATMSEDKETLYVAHVGCQEDVELLGGHW